MAQIFLSIPIMDKPELKMIYTLYRAISSSGKHQVRLFFNENDSLISRIRNVHMSEFYHHYPECDYFMSIDSDLEIVNSFSDNNIFNKLVSHDKEFVGGLYAVKKPGVVRCSSIASSGVTPEFDSGLAEMKWLSSGCWCIKRSAVEKMIKAYPDLEYDGDDNVVGKKIYGLYTPMIYDLKEGDFPEGYNISLPFKKYLSEDWSYCQRWKAIGGQIFADTSIVLRHIGKMQYSLYNVDIVKKSDNVPPSPGYNLKS